MRDTTDRVLVGLLFLLASVACEEERDPELRPHCPSWKTEVQDAVETRCAGCHPSFSRYATFTSDALARPGALDSPILTVLAPTTTIAGHRVPVETRAMLTAWVTSCDLRYSDTPVHAGGLLDPRSDDFHAKAWRASQYSTTTCRDCHGSLSSGRGDAPGCETCHAGGEEACSTCHARIYEKGAHGVHISGGALGLRYECALCHAEPETFRAPNHTLLPNGELDELPPEVMLGEAAGPNAHYDPASGTCAEVACHVARPGDTAAARPEPVWTAPLSEPACDRCHGEPPAGHVSDRCLDCHPSPVQPDGTNASRHLNRQVDLGRSGSGTCDDCHGSGASGAPPPSLSGATDPRVPEVGAHRAHLEPSRRLANPAACGDCHLVPTEISQPGHVDTPAPAEVFPEAIRATSLAFGRGITPEFRREDLRCSGVYCHWAAEPHWTTIGLNEITCGSCHPIPPDRAPHYPGLRITECGTCHTSTIDLLGNFRFVDTPEGRRTTHINGRVDF